MEKGLISVLMPVYNGSRTIERAIRSLELQTYHNWKLIIVDDGSKDNTRDILRAYRDNPKFKIVYHEVNKGRGAARQTALENAEGEYIAFLDVDDFYHPEKLQKQIEVFNNNPDITLVGCSLMSFNATNNFRVRGKGDEVIIKLEKNETIKFVAASTLLRKKDTNGIRYNSKLNAAEDIDFLNKVLFEKKYYLLPDILYYYEQDEQENRDKILEYYLQTVKKYYYDSKTFNLRSIKNLILSIIKAIIVRLLLMINRTDILFSKRGRLASVKQIKEYNEVIKKLTL